MNRELHGYGEGEDLNSSENTNCAEELRKRIIKLAKRKALVPDKINNELLEYEGTILLKWFLKLIINVVNM